MVQRIANVPLQFDPGTRWNYGISTDVVGFLCEVISGQPFERYLEERIFQPLRMTDSGFQVPESQKERFAACYRRGGENEPLYVLQDAPAESPYTKPRTYFSGAGGMVSTAADYMRFCKMLANGGELDGARILGRARSNLWPRTTCRRTGDMATVGMSRFNETTMDGSASASVRGADGPAKAQIMARPASTTGRRRLDLLLHQPEGGPDHDLPDPAPAIVDLPIRELR
jgi:CubicO group peptidase (beta-lactamase class C family)